MLFLRMPFERRFIPEAVIEVVITGYVGAEKANLLHLFWLSRLLRFNLW